MPAEDPLDVLGKIVGIPRPRDDDSRDGAGPAEKPASLAQDIDFAGLSLGAFAQQKSYPKARTQAEIKQLSTQSVEECEYVES